MLDEGPAAKRLRKYQEEGMCLLRLLENIILT
jgi:hypothetical protein